MKYFIPILLLIIFSCKPDAKDGLNTDSEKNTAYAMYGLLMQELSYSIAILNEQITQSLENGKLYEIQSAKSYDSLTKGYLEFLRLTKIKGSSQRSVLLIAV